MAIVLNKLKTLLLAICITLLGSIFPTSSFADQEVSFSVSAFIIEGDNPLGDEANTLLQPYLGDHNGLDGLYAAKDAFEKKLREKGFAFYRVTLPAQTLENGVVKFNVNAFKVTDAAVEGNQHFTKENILASIPELLPGNSPSIKDLSSNLALANANPSKSISLSFKAGEQPETLTAILKVKDIKPDSYFILLSNAGTQETALSRMSLGYQNNNLFDKDHSMTVTYTTSPEEPSDINQFGLSYQAPLYDHGAKLGFLVSASNVESGSVANNVEVKGSGNVINMSYARPLPRGDNYRHGFNLSLNHKLYENDITVGGTPEGSDVTSSPLKLAYDGSWTYPTNGVSVHIDYESNLSFGSNNEDTDYEAVRTGATADWTTIHYSLNYSQRFSNRSLFLLRMKGQQSSDVLISGEAFGVGGANSTRAYEERSVLGDTGNEISLEFVSQPLTSYKLKALAFTDFAKVQLNDVQPGSEETTDISSAGIGLRWNKDRTVSFKLDMGYALKDALAGTTSEIEKGDVKAHASFFYRF